MVMMVVLYTATNLIVSHYFNDTLSYKYKRHDGQYYTSYVCFCHLSKRQFIRVIIPNLIEPTLRLSRLVKLALRKGLEPNSRLLFYNLSRFLVSVEVAACMR